MPEWWSITRSPKQENSAPNSINYYIFNQHGLIKVEDKPILTIITKFDVNKDDDSIWWKLMIKQHLKEISSVYQVITKKVQNRRLMTTTILNQSHFRLSRKRNVSKKLLKSTINYSRVKILSSVHLITNTQGHKWVKWY